MRGYQIIISYSNKGQVVADARKGQDEAIICGRTNKMLGRFYTRDMVKKTREATQVNHTAFTMMRTLRHCRKMIEAEEMVDVTVVDAAGVKFVVFCKDAVLPGYCAEGDAIIQEAQLLVQYLTSGEDMWLSILSDMLGDEHGLTLVKNETGMLADAGESEKQAAAGTAPEPISLPRRTRRRRAAV